jgi:hypothetical protein
MNFEGHMSPRHAVRFTPPPSAEQACAVEGGRLPPHPQDERQGRGPLPKAQRIRKVKRARGETLKWLGMQGLRAAGFLFAAWALACVFHPGARPF